jgi:hypothetical protein
MTKRTSIKRLPNRRGSALLLCTLAAAVLSVSAIAIIRSTQRGIVRVESQQAARQGRATTEGLLQRSIAILRTNPLTTGTIPDPAGPAGAYADLRAMSPTATQIQIFLYANSTIPAKSIVVDPTSL